MIYAMSDLHGCYEKYLKMLEKINFGAEDTLYVLGNIIDRGSGGIKILMDMMTRDNVIVIRGNHDELGYKVMKFISQPSDMYESEKIMPLYRIWLLDGGMSTFNEFMRLSADEQNKLLSYMSSFLFYKEITVNGRKFFMAHTVPKKAEMQDPEKMPRHLFIDGEPEYEKEYFPDEYIVTGHTPTGLIDEKYTGKIMRANNHIAIDCGAIFGNPLGCICLDTLEEFYVED